MLVDRSVRLRLLPALKRRMCGWSLASHVLLAGAVSCSDGPTQPQSEPDIRTLVTGEAADFVDADGHFIHNVVTPPSHFAAIDAARAALLAPAFVRTFAWPVQSVGTPLGERLEHQHGAPIDLGAIQARQVVLGASPYADAGSGAPTWLRNLVSPKFIVWLEQRSLPAISVGVAAYAADVELVGDRVGLPQESGNEFGAVGIPVNQGQLYPISAERAAVVASRETGALIASVPRLLLPGRLHAFDSGRWQVTLDRDVVFRRASGATSTTRTVYVGVELTSSGTFLRHDGLFVPALVQPSEDTLSIDPLIVITRKAGVPLNFDAVVPVR